MLQLSKQNSGSPTGELLDLNMPKIHDSRMSDDENSQATSDEENLLTTGLIATRAKRSTAGNLYATLRQNLDDEELQKELLAEDEEDVGDYEGSDRDGDDDEAMDSSSDEEDGGPPKDGEAEDLEGERELKKTERADARKKRKLEQAKLRVPGWQSKKKVKLADDAKTEDGTPERPKKKSDRSAWLPAGPDAPIRQSERASAVANREITHAHLKQSAARSEKQRKVMKNAAERDRANKRAQLTQEERLAKAAKIEKETSREFGRWEREEAERQRIREEQLAAKRRRGLEGPVIRHWSGSVLWEGEKIKMKRLHGSKTADEIQEEYDKKDVDKDKNTEKVQSSEQDVGISSTNPSSQEVQGQNTASSNLTPPSEPPDKSRTTNPIPSSLTISPAGLDTLAKPPASSESLVSSQTEYLAGIHEYAAQTVNDPPILVQPESSSTPSLQPPLQPAYMPSAPSIHVGDRVTEQSPTVQDLQSSQPSRPPLPTPQQMQDSVSQIPHQQAPQINPSWPPGCQQFSLQMTLPPPPPAPPAPPAPPPPLIREQAQRSLVVLEQFEKLDSATSSNPTSSTRQRNSHRNMKDSTNGPHEPSLLASTLLPGSYPSFTTEEARYLNAKMRKRGADLSLPAAPLKTRCAVTSWPAKFRDPKTGLPYAELPTYRIIQRLLAGGCAWSGLLGGWVGPTYGSLGRPAKGVPEGFAASFTAAPAGVGVAAAGQGGEGKRAEIGNGEGKGEGKVGV